MAEVSQAKELQLEVRGVRKRYGPTLALDGVDLAVRAGEVHALIGENGAGKSTLMKVLSGAVRPDEGEVYVAGTRCRPAHPADAQRLGIAMIYQELNLAPDLSVEENIVLGREPSALGLIDRGKRRALAEEALAAVEASDIDPRSLIRDLSVARQQMVEIARACLGDPRLIIMDEPTSSLGREEVQQLFKVVRRLREQGRSVIYISHFLEECESLADRFTVLRDGRSVLSGEMSQTSLSDIIAAMVGREMTDLYPSRKHEPGSVLLRVEGLQGEPAPARATFELRRGEVLGFAGLVGAGRSETLRTLFGLDGLAGGVVEIHGKPYAPSPERAIASGLGLVSEDRKSEGLMLNRSLADNLVLSSLELVSAKGIYQPGLAEAATREQMKALSVKAQSPTQPIGALSGGNQQKIAIARLLQQQADLFLLDEPTRGIDIGSKAQIYELINQLAEDGKAVLFVSSYLPELLGLCDRISVFARGQLVETRARADWDEHSIMEAATATPSAA